VKTRQLTLKPHKQKEDVVVMVKPTNVSRFIWHTLLLCLAMCCTVPFPAQAKKAVERFTVTTPSQAGYWTKQQEFNSFGCTGQNLSPALHWQNVPANTQSLAVTVYDPDAPTGSGWWHWTVVNLPPQTTHLLPGGPLPTGAIEGRTDYGSATFGGACPPEGDKPHRYIITVWALDVSSLPIDSQSSGALVGYYLNAHKLAKASLTVRYGR
jgi:Raf kinase inhibitor-like YbhB/YbcL family protein